MFLPPPVAIEQLEGPIERLRLTAAADGRFVAWIAGQQVHGRTRDAFNAPFAWQALQRMALNAMPARVGVLVYADGRREAHWAVAAGSAGLIPMPTELERKLALAQAMRWLPVLALWSIWSGVALPQAHAGLGWMLLLLIALGGTAGIAATLATQAWTWLQHRRRRPILAASEHHLVHAIGAMRKQHRAWSRRLRTAALRRAARDAARAQTQGDDWTQTLADDNAAGTVALQRLHGRLPMPWSSQGLHGEGSSMLLMDDYRFALCGRYLSLRALHGPGYPTPFLAMGDRVEVLVPAQERAEADSVYALRNLEDGRIYIAHGGFRLLAGGDPAGEHALTGFTARSYRLRGVSGAAVALIATTLCYFVFGFDPDEAGRSLERAGFFAAVFVAMIAAIALPYAWSRRRWRSGRANARERLTERVYAALDLGSPLAPLPAHAHDV
ncbi:hypothetical protein [Lysobacter enzymogenes]|uniref:hypothetical protein n=1 Tax=Lysobacter enzymogenes TaxID=69 RepID=UPI00099B4F6A|nr:hypothetical protein [Lysobacter enzymogenes]UZW60611.1 hypothetical protein BV903_025745 [Lysobacter enzymogenes]